MKILPLDNKYNISSKAYFKQNAMFKTLYGKHEFLHLSTIDRFKRLPKHEIEITELVLPPAKNAFCTVFNNVTKRAVSTELMNIASSMQELIDFLVSDECKSFFEDKCLPINIHKYVSLTQNDK